MSLAPILANFLYLVVISATAQFKIPAAFFGSVTTSYNKCGILLYTWNSTTLGSITIIRTSSGVVLYRILIKIEFVNTDLPEPVVPAISICGIFAISATTTRPAISLPAGKASLDLCSLSSLDISNSFRYTVSLLSLGISIPTAALPGIGASIRISAAAILSLISSAKPVILLTFVPISGCNSYLVTEGPLLTLVTSTFTPKLVKTSLSLLAVCINTAFVVPLELPGLSANNLYGGFL